MSRVLEPECTAKCRSRKHALEVNVSITKATLREIQSFAHLCHHGTELCDYAGRLAIHMAVSCGKRDVIEWLVTEKHADQGAKDWESGWTPLHRSLFYGNIDVARFLIQHGSDMYSRDHEGLGSLDMVMKDRPAQITFSSKEPNEVYAWGDNVNFNLGHASGHRRPVPEVVDQLKKLNVSIKQVVMCKYHTVFVSQSGQVYTCGHGHGGRLGHGDELTCLVPKLVECVCMDVCIQAAASQDHTILLMESGNVYSCGLNDCHQLGQFPTPEKSLVPKQVNIKFLKAHKLAGVCAGQFHTVFYTTDAVYTFGLNAGQLGHAKAERRQSHPRQVSALNHKDISFLDVTCSDAATVCLTFKGDIYVLHEYQCRKITSRWTDISKLLVSGGNLDHNTDVDVLREKGGSELVIALLVSTGKVFLWRTTSPTLRRCQWAIQRQLYVTDVVISSSNLAFVTEQGEAFIGFWTQRKTASQKENSVIQNKNVKDGVDEFGTMTLIDLLLKDEVEDVPVRRIPNAHRATSIHSDKKGSNFMLLQVLPNCCLSDLPSVTNSEMKDNLQVLLDEADEFDCIHDIVVQAGNRLWSAHRYILASRSDHFRKFIFGSTKPKLLNDKPVISIPDIPTEILEQVLNFVYTDTCDLLTPGTRFEAVVSHVKSNIVDDRDSGISDGSDLITPEKKKTSAFEVQQKKKSGKNVKEKEQQAYTGKNPIKLLQDVAKRLGVKGLSKRLDAVKFVNGVVQANNKYLAIPKIKFERTKLCELYDVCIKGEDNMMVHCHKCVLVARLEYFHCMLGSGWIETSNSTSLSLPIPGDILLILLDFLYTDESAILSDCSNAELLCNVLVVADQLLVVRLKEICEVSLVNLLNFRNVAELLEFASVYNASQLKCSCQQLISLNLAAMLEGRYLDVLSDETIVQLKEYYRNLIPGMTRRLVTPFDESPSRTFLESLPSVCADNSVTDSHDHLGKKRKKRRSRTQSVTDDAEKSEPPLRERQISLSSDLSVDDNAVVITTDITTIVPELALPAAQQKEKKYPSAFIPLTNRDASSPWGCKSPTSAQSRDSARSPPHRDLLVIPDSPGTTLRDIMAAEKELHSKHHPLAKVSPGKFSWKDVKKQQNQREMQGRLGKDMDGDKTADGLVTSPKQTVCPWGSVNKVVQSFRALIVEEKGNTPVHLPVKVKRDSVLSETGLVSPGHKSGRRGQSGNAGDWRSESLMIPKPSQKAWQTDHTPSPPVSSVIFLDIVKDEQQQRETLDRASKKPLGLIQVEEQAMHELLQHYRASGCPNEYITVERVPQAVAVPLWKRDSQGACGGQ